MIRLTPETFAEKIAAYKANGVPFELYSSNETSKLINLKLGIKYFTGDPISSKELGFVNTMRVRLKKRIEDLNVTVPKKYRKPQYFRLGPITPDEKYTDVIEIDINNAYWQTARIVNLIDEETFQLGLTKSKKSRLAGLGQLGKRQAVFHFDGFRMRRKADRVDKVNEYVWNQICLKTTNTLNDISENCPFILYWVDAMFVQKKHAAAVKRMLKNAGYMYKTKKIEYIELSNNVLHVHTDANNIKVFNLKKKA